MGTSTCSTTPAHRLDKGARLCSRVTKENPEDVVLEEVEPLDHVLRNLCPRQCS